MNPRAELPRRLCVAYNRNWTSSATSKAISNVSQESRIFITIQEVCVVVPNKRRRMQVVLVIVVFKVRVHTIDIILKLTQHQSNFIEHCRSPRHLMQLWLVVRFKEALVDRMQTRH